MKKTPLFEEHLELGARMAEFGGWNMPIQYQGILAEHHHTRTKTGVFDICHMGEFELSGPSAVTDLELLLTLNVATLSEGQCRYGFLLDEQGGVIDDLTCYRLAKERYLLVVNAATLDEDSAWIQAHLSQDTVFTDRSNELAKIDVQGPSARVDLENVLGERLPSLGYFRAQMIPALGTKILLSRTGYTGELGYELYFPVSEAVRIWRALLDNENIKPVGLGARDTLRLEMGYSLYGHELSRTRTPAPTCRGMFLRKNGGFLGEAAVRRELESPTELLVALRFDSKRAARAQDKVLSPSGDHSIGTVTSGSLSPSLENAIALAFVDVNYADLGTVLNVEIRGKLYPATVVSLPFYDQGTARS